ncbi:hypothetical protein ACQPZA_30860 [Pseudonocardia xinjiangensis]|uniref:hypothetical protein n=1 Tax=Pseudonocardia xinjiangensis TaxID=75289 RepID=UPI003D8A8111
MSRHRSPSGRYAHPRPATGVAFPGALTEPPRRSGARHRVATPTAVRNGMNAAAAAGGVLAVVVPGVGMATAPVPGAAADESSLIRLASDEQPVDGDADPNLRTRTGVVLVSSAPDEPEPPQVDVAGLVKAAGLADVARRIEDERAARAASANCDADLDGLGRVKPWVRDAAAFLSCLYDEPRLGGVAQRSRSSDHPSGHALDLMVRGERGDRIAECALANQDELGITYVLWEQRANYGDGWERMSDRGSDTENHNDHVHISFERSAPDEGEPLAERCD